MKTIKKMLMFIMVLSMVVTTVPSTVEAKAKAYKTKTVKVTEGKKVTIKTKEKIKSVKLCSKDKGFEAEKCGSKKFYVAWTTYGVKQTVKVKYNNGRTQKFNIKTVPDKYGQKIVNELKPLLADPDEGLKKIVSDSLKMMNKNCGSHDHEMAFYSDKVSKNGVYVTEDNVTEVLKDYSYTEKQAYILGAYMDVRMNYSKTKIRTSMKALYNGNFSGMCCDGAWGVNKVCRYLGIKSRTISCDKWNHEWCCMYVKDKNGNGYWKQVRGTAYGVDLKASIDSCKAYSHKRYSEKKIKKYAIGTVKKVLDGLRVECVY